MEKEFYNKYMKYNFTGITGPIKKTQKYNMIDYTNAYLLIKDYKKSHNLSDVSETTNYKRK
jgi:hypothetical protein